MNYRVCLDEIGDEGGWGDLEWHLFNVSVSSVRRRSTASAAGLGGKRPGPVPRPLRPALIGLPWYVVLPSCARAPGSLRQVGPAVSCQS